MNTCRLANLTLNSPLILGANDAVQDFKAFDFIAQYAPQLGAITTKSFTYHARYGNQDPILAMIDNNLMVSSGIRNPGINIMLKEIANYNKKYQTPLLIANIAPNPDSLINPEQELAEMAYMLYQNGTHIIELNLSCPNLNSKTIVADDGGMVYKIITHIKNYFARHNINDYGLIAKLAGDASTSYFI